MTVSADFQQMHADTLEAMGDPARYDGAGNSMAIHAVLDLTSLEVGEFGVTVAARPSIAVLTRQVPAPVPGDTIAMLDDAGNTLSTWVVLRPAETDGMVTRLWVEASP